MPNSLLEYRGEYKMEGRLGESASGPVYCAQDAFGRALAIKVLTPPSASPIDPEVPDRLQGETNLKHKNILPILSLFRNKERICIVTELLEGRNLRELIGEDQSLSLLDRVEIMTQAGEALRYAHANGIVHRGLKPSHIHVQPDGTVKVRNFSIDLPPEAAQYMAPEQVSGQPLAGQKADALCNIFTWGVILNELTANCPEHPALLTSIIERALNKDRESRYQSFDELLPDAARLLVQLRKTDLEFTGLFESWPARGSDAAPSQFHEDLQFTVYRPRAVRPGQWRTLLAFAHLSERPDDVMRPRDVQPRDVQQWANQILEMDGAKPIPCEGELTFVPQMDGVEFNPRRVSLIWKESLHQAAFRLRASPGVDGQTVQGQMCVYLGSVILAQVALKIEVNSHGNFQAEEDALAPVTAARYRKVFACYSLQDSAVVEELERYGRAMGDEYLRDLMRLRSSGAVNDRLLQMIDQADVFQLFWSSHSIRSPYICQEWQYALTLKRDCFVRPVYWEDALPEIRELNLPPEELRRLQFHRMVPEARGTTAAPAAAPSLPQAKPAKRRSFGLALAAALLILAVLGGVGWLTVGRVRRPPPAAQGQPPPRRRDPYVRALVGK